MLSHKLKQTLKTPNSPPRIIKGVSFVKQTNESHKMRTFRFDFLLPCIFQETGESSLDGFISIVILSEI